MCDECQGARCSGKFAPFFCANVTCLQVFLYRLFILSFVLHFMTLDSIFQYYCEHCWATIHSRPGREFHKPLVKEGAERPRAVPFRWCQLLIVNSCNTCILRTILLFIKLIYRWCFDIGKSIIQKISHFLIILKLMFLKSIFFLLFNRKRLV